MWFGRPICLLLLSLASARAGETGKFPVALVIMNDCEGPSQKANTGLSGDSAPHCAEPFFEPTFGFKVVAGTWPEKGVIRCKSAGHALECDGGLRLEIERITFH